MEFLIEYYNFTILILQILHYQALRLVINTSTQDTTLEFNVTFSYKD